MAYVLLIRLLDESIITILVSGKLLIWIDRAVGVGILLVKDGSPQGDGEGFLKRFSRYIRCNAQNPQKSLQKYKKQYLFPKI